MHIRILGTRGNVRPSAPRHRRHSGILVSRAVRVGDCRVVPVPTVHSHRLRSVGYVVEKGMRRIFFSSDLVAIEPRYRRRLAASTS